MRIVKKYLLVLGIFVLFIPFLPILEVFAQASDYTLTSVSGIWTDVDGGGYTVAGVGTNEARWGIGRQEYYWEKSGLRFDGTGSQSFNEGEVFLLGTLTYLNWPVKPPAADGTTLEVMLTFGSPSITPAPSFSFDFEIEETTDRAGSCPDWQVSGTPCDDRVTFPSSYGEKNFQIGDKLYTLKIVGFRDSLTGGTPVDAFIAGEAKNNSIYLVGMLSSVLVPEPDITLTKKTNDIDVTEEPGPELVVGDSVTWHYIVQNTGNAALTEVAVVDNEIGSITCPQRILDPGELMTCTESGTVTEGQYSNTATVTASHSEGSTSDSDTSWYYGITASIDVEKNFWSGSTWEDADVTPGPELAEGENPVYQFVLTNDGDVTLSDVSLSDPKITDFYGDAGLETPCTILITLNPDDYFICYASSRWASGAQMNTAKATGKYDGVTYQDTDRAHYFGADPDILLTKTAIPTAFTAVDDVITYTFVAENTGNVTLSEVVIADPLSGLSTLSCDLTAPVSLLPGAQLTCTATYTVKQDDLNNGLIENTSMASGKDSSNAEVSDDDEAVVEGPKTGASIRLVKVADPLVFTEVGEEISYTFVVVNNGIFTLTNVKIEDPLPGLSALECDVDQPAELAPGAAITCEATYQVTQNDIDNGSIENVAVARGTGSNEEEVDDDDGAVVEGSKDEASIHLDKSADPATYDQVGDEITYTFVVMNDGIYTLTDVVITDALFGLAFGPIDTLDPGESEIFKYTYAVTQADVDANKILNVATVTGKDPSDDPVTSTDDETVYGPEQPKVTPEPKELPITGFSPNRVTVLPAQPAAKAYAQYSDFWLEIPKLGIKVDIVGVPTSDVGWDVTWLGQQTGWLYGTTFPTWPGNATITGHVWDALDRAGPFVNLDQLAYGDQIVIHLEGSKYIFEVRSRHLVLPEDTSIIEQTKTYSWVNLITCQGFNEESEAYLYRLIVRAVLVDVE